MASEAPDFRPLLHDFHTSDIDFTPKKAANVSLRSLEDGSDSAFSEDEELTQRSGFWKLLRMSMRRRRNGVAREPQYESVRLPLDSKKSAKKFGLRRKHAARACVVVPLLVIIFFGVVHILNVFLGFVPLLWDDPAASSLDWSSPEKASSDIASHLLDITRDVTPIPCHSHNDYWRRVPLYDALRWGCTGVEADVWLFDDDLFVGHSTNALTQNRTFRSMYVDPLVRMLDHKNEPGDFAIPSTIKNGVFDTVPAQTLVLLVDFKNNGHDIFPVVSQQLSSLRERGYLTYFDGESTIEGAITVVATGNAPFDLITANTTYRDIFFDAPLDRFYDDLAANDDSQQPKDLGITTRGGQGTVGTSPTSHFDSTNSYYASVNFGKSIGWLWFGHISSEQRNLIHGQIRGAHARGLKARYWSAPKWPIGLRNKVWSLLVDEGVDYLNGDDLSGMTRLDWGTKRHGSLIG
ncbi:PLC-like phosphodiesterase [Pyrenochaeta sp. MPI-SDFR-AT-0127]|nr:PLC-like phosphodiesterase [Pyrenochaeta sp. MPI-SDFR-AT-0127]